MKKMFAASFIAIMAVSAANAEIASVSYTDNAIKEKTGDISTLATSTKANLTAAVNELVGKVGTQNVDTQVSAALTEAKAYTDQLADGAVATNTAKIAGMDLATTGGAGSFIQTVAQADGTVTATATAFETILDDTTKNSVIAPTTKAVKSYVDTQFNTIDGINSNLLGRVETLEGWQTTAKTSIADNGEAIKDLQAEDTQLAGAIASGDTATLNSAKEYADSLATNYDASGSAAQALADAKADAASKDSALETKITNAYKAADTSLETALKKYADDAAAGASGEAGEVASDLAAYIQSNDTAVAAAKTQADKGVADAAAAKTQADKGVADAAAAKAAADAAQADADANAAAIADLDTTYVSESEMTTFKSSNTSAIATAKTEAIAAAKTAGDAAYDAKGAAAAAQTAAVNAAKSAADATYQVKSSALSVGAANGAWTDLTKAAGYSATGTHSLVLKNGTIQWEAVRYAE